MPPSLGVLITYYNEGKLLTECLDSLLSGSDKPDEILIYDDASQDPAERHVKAHYPVRIIRGKENIGIGRARNELTKASRSDYIHFHDADDYFDPMWCSSVKGAMVRSNPGIILTNVLLVKAHDPEFPGEPLYSFQDLFAKDDLLEFFFSRTICILVAMTTYRREAALWVGGFRPREVLDLAEDFEFHLRLFGLGLPFEVIPHCLTVRRRRPNSLSHDGDVKLRKEVNGHLIKSLHLLSVWLPERYHMHVMTRLHRDGIPQASPEDIEHTKRALRLARELGLIGGSGKPFTHYPAFIAQKLLKNGVLLFRAGETDLARLVFREARRYGPVRRNKGSKWYRFVFRWLGPEAAERSADFYTRLLPAGWRTLIRKI